MIGLDVGGISFGSRGGLTHGAAMSGPLREKRRGQRRTLWVRCWVQDGLAERYAHLADIGEGGARVMTAGPPAVGERLQLRFLLAADTIEAQARVVWRIEGQGGRGGAMGVEFLVVSAPAELKAFVRGAA